MFTKLIANYRLCSSFFFTMTKQPPVGQDLLIVEASRLHSGTTQSVGILCTSDQAVPDNTQQSLGTDIHAICGIRTRIPSKRAAVEPCLRPRGKWDRPLCVNMHRKKIYTKTKKTKQNAKRSITVICS